MSRTETQFRPGVSGNPLGRPRIDRDVAVLARQYTPEAIEALHEIARDPKAPAMARMKAATTILHRAYGRPPTVDALAMMEQEPSRAA